MNSQILKLLSILFLLVATLHPYGYGQKVMEFNDSRLIQGSISVPAGVNMFTVPARDTTFVVPVGKIWKFEGIFTGQSAAPYSKPSGSNILQVIVNNCFVASWTGSSNPFVPFSLPAGSYSLKYYLSASGTNSTDYYFKFFISILEYNSQP